MIFQHCYFVFHYQETPTGLYVSLTTFLGFGADYVSKYFEHIGNGVFLHIKRTKHEVRSIVIYFCSEKILTIKFFTDTSRPNR